MLKVSQLVKENPNNYVIIDWTYLKYWKGISSSSSKWKAILNILEISLATAALSHVLLRLTLPIRPNSANWALRVPRGMAKMSPSSNGMRTTSLVTTFDFPFVDLVEEAHLRLGAGKYDCDFSTFLSWVCLKSWRKEDGNWRLAAGDCSPESSEWRSS